MVNASNYTSSATTRINQIRGHTRWKGGNFQIIREYLVKYPDQNIVDAYQLKILPNNVRCGQTKEHAPTFYKV